MIIYDVLALSIRIETIQCLVFQNILLFLRTKLMIHR
jgi:hypothetical protein